MGIIQDIHDDLEKGAAQLVAEYRDRLCRDALALCGDAAEAEDFAFRTFDKVLRKIDTFKGEGSFYEWMKAILVNDIRSAKRTKASQNTVVSEIAVDEPVPSGAPGTAEQMMESFDSEVVRSAIGKLSAEHREAIVLHYFLDQPVGKMAKLLAIPEGTVKFRLYAARKALAGMLSEQMKRPVVRMMLLIFGLGAFAATAYIGGNAIWGEAEAEPPEIAEVATVDKNDVFDVQEGENMIMTRKVASLVGASLLAVASPGTEIESEETFVFLRPETSSFWNTATNSTMSLPIDYPNGATKATLEVKGVGYDKTYSDITADSYEIELPVPDSPQTENVYDLKLTFDDGTVRTAKLGLIQGLSPDSEGATRCLAPAEGSVWEKVKYRAVLPIPYGTTSLSMQTNGGEWKEIDTGLNGAQGWYALSPIARGSSLSLSCIVDGVSHVASLLGGGDGFFVIVK